LINIRNIQGIANMPIRTTGGVFDEQVLTGSLAHYVVCGADFSGAINSYGQAVPNSAAEIIFTEISRSAYINIMNPNECNLSFALEAGRSTWDEISLTLMVQSLGSNVGVDNIDCSVCIVKRVPYVWGCSDGAESFLELSDTPASYVGAAGYVVTVDANETGLIFTPATASNAFAFIASPGQPTITSVGSDTLNIVAGTNVSIISDSGTNSLTINSTGSTSGDYIPVPPGTILSTGLRYYVTSAGTVTLPALTGSSITAGQSVYIAKNIGETVSIIVGNLSDVIATDLGNTDEIEFDATQHCIFIANGSAEWELQIGSRL
jgi:hypothetical protein